MAEAIEIFRHAASSFDIGPATGAQLAQLRTLLEPQLATLNAELLQALTADSEAASIVSTQREALTASISSLISGLFVWGDLEARILRRTALARTLAGMKLPARCLDLLMGLLRQSVLSRLSAQSTDLSTIWVQFSCLLKVMDLDLLMLHQAYADDLFERLSLATGMRRRLIENLMKTGKS